MNAMTGDEVKIAMEALGLDVYRASRVFGVTPETVWRWRKGGCAPHIGAVFDALAAGEVTMRGAKWMKWRIGGSRRDGDRYRAGSALSSRDRLSA